MKKLILSIALLQITISTFSQKIYIPDPNFRTWLQTNYTSCMDGDSLITNCSEVINATSINVSNKGFADLTGIEAFTALTNLNCFNNQLTSLNVSANTALTTLFCGSNSLSNLDVSANNALTALKCYENQLTSLNVSGANELTTLYCYSNQLTSLNVSSNTALTGLYCWNNQLTILDVSVNTALTGLYCNNNQLVSLNVSANSALIGLYCHANQLTSLNVSANTALSYLLCGNNLLTSLNVKNGNNSNFSSFIATNNPNLTCINVDNAAWSTANWTNIDSWASFNENCNCIVNIPDANFKAALVGNSAINTNGDSEIQCDEANSFTGTINVNNLNISDLTGIEAFIALTTLYCNNNQLTSLNISTNTALTNLNCGSNKLTSLDVSSNTALTYLGCYYNQLTSLNVSANTALNDLRCSNNQLTSLDVSANTALTYLNCSWNQLTSLDVSTNTSLTTLGFYSNQLTSLDVSANTALTFLDCSKNQLTSLDVSTNTVLAFLNCCENQLTSLDVSTNTVLTYLYCCENQLISLNVKNGNNINFTNFIAGNNPNLTCINVDNAAWSTANWSSNIDSWASFNENCYINVNSISNCHTEINIYPNPTDGKFYISIEGLRNDGNINIIDVTGKTVFTEILTKETTLKQVDLSNLSKGIYAVKLTTVDVVKVSRIVIQK